MVQNNNSGNFTATLTEVQAGDRIQILIQSSSSYLSSVQAFLVIGSVTSSPWIVTTLAQATNQPACAPNEGQACNKGGSTQEVQGCQDGYQCVSFTGVYYNSQIGCAGSPTDDGSHSWIENSFDGVNTYYQGVNASGNATYPKVITGNVYGASRCSFMGTPNDPFRTPPTGECHHNPGTDSHSRVILGSGCKQKVYVPSPGVYACDGSCR